MRADWTYKTWADVLTIINGKNQSAVESANGEFPIYGSGGIMGYASAWLCPENSVIIGRKGNINKPLYVTTKFWNVDTAFGLCAKEELLLPKYLFYFCKDYNFERHNRAVTIPSLTKADLLKISILVPPISVQQSIVAELDKINELIRLKKSQLNDLEQLVQSIFFAMFGDPIINEMGWTTQKLEVLTKSEGGGTPSKSKPEYWNGDIIWVSSKDMKSTYISDSLIHITQEGVNNSPAHILPIGTILIVNRSGILKHTLPLAITTKEVTINQDIKALVVNSDKIINLYLLYCLKAFSPFLLSKVKAVTVDSIDYAIIKNLQIPLPPLSIQESFAAQIAVIEEQRKQITASINDLETLLSSRMQYWFE